MSKEKNYQFLNVKYEDVADMVSIGTPEKNIRKLLNKINGSQFWFNIFLKNVAAATNRNNNFLEAKIDELEDLELG